MSLWDDYLPQQPRFDIKNFALGAVVSCLLIGVLGYGTIIAFAAITPRDEGVNIGGALLATLGCLVAVALGAAFTAWRARRRRGQPIPEGVSAGLVGFTLAVIGAGHLIFVVGEVPLLEIVSVLPLLVPGVPVSGRRAEQHPRSAPSGAGRIPEARRHASRLTGLYLPAYTPVK